MNNTTADSQLAEDIRNKVIRFPNGLPGFPTSHEFVMVQQPEERPFAWMKSMNDPNLSFAVVDAYSWDRDYILEVDDAELDEMGSVDPLDYAVYFILRINKEDERTTLRAKPNAPVLVNVRTRQARQVVVPVSSSMQKAEALCLQL
jgi:flagellar assembly factor FliW